MHELVKIHMRQMEYDYRDIFIYINGIFGRIQHKYMLNEFISGAIAIFNYLCEQNAVYLIEGSEKWLKKFTVLPTIYPKY